jgi:PleD family two-component response regulator
MMESLRAGDIITRYSTAQFIVMLPVTKREDAHAIMKRVEDKFNDIENRTKVKVTYSVDHAKM